MSGRTRTDYYEVLTTRCLRLCVLRVYSSQLYGHNLPLREMVGKSADLVESTSIRVIQSKMGLDGTQDGE